MDALTAAKARIDRALNEIEAKLHTLKARAGEVSVPDDDLFAPLPSSAADQARIADLESAGQEAAEALAAAAQAVRDVLEQHTDNTGDAEGAESGVESR